jgi:hypothetical protein
MLQPAAPTDGAAVLTREDSAAGTMYHYASLRRLAPPGEDPRAPLPALPSVPSSGGAGMLLDAPSASLLPGRQSLRQQAGSQTGVGGIGSTTASRLYLWTRVGRAVGIDGAVPDATNRAPKTLDEKLSTPVDVLLFDAGTSAVWRCRTSIGELKPAVVDIDGYARVLADVFGFALLHEEEIRKASGGMIGSGTSAASPLVQVLPSFSLPPTTPIARVEATVAAAGGRASLAIAVLHCTLCSSGLSGRAEVMDGLASVSADRLRLARLLDAERLRTASLVAERERLVEEGKRKEHQLLQASLLIVNAKKSKIRELAEALDAANSQVAELEAQLQAALARHTERRPRGEDAAAEGPPSQRGPMSETQLLASRSAAAVDGGPSAVDVIDEEGDSDASYDEPEDRAPGADAVGAGGGRDSRGEGLGRTSTADLLGMSM